MQVVSPSISVRGSLVSFHQPWVLGIVNVTPDSFHDGGKNLAPDQAVLAANSMIDRGADALDVGAQSTRPGAPQVGAEEEWRRLEPVLRAIRADHPEVPLSIDTYHASVAARAIHAGADIINDVSGGAADPRMWPVVAEAGVPYILMHMQGTPETMQNNPTYDNVLTDILSYLTSQRRAALDAGIADVIIDVGFGFGKSVAHNFALLRDLEAFQRIGAPILVGVSRKSMIQRVLEVDSQHALNGTTALHAWALDRGAHVLRVHDVLEARQAVLLHQAMKTSHAT
jgi:dihydropteroate synthase